MTILALGINHKTATVGIREKVSFQPEQLEMALQSLIQQGKVSETVIVSTCNRTELYCHAESSELASIIEWLANFHQVSATELTQYLYHHADQDAVAHLMSVAAGLDSLVLGEPQILGQVKQAFQQAREAGTVGSVFERLFQSAFATAKVIRTETEVGQNAVSVAFAAVNLAKHIFSSLHEANVLLVGAGETAELAARHLRDQGVKTIRVANRTVARAEELAHLVGGEAYALSSLKSLLPKSDIIISSTASPVPVIGKGTVEAALKERRHQPMLFIDLAVPRDIEEQVNDLEDIYLYTVDDLQSIVSRNLEQRQQAATEARDIIQRHVAEFTAWMQSLNSVDLLRQYRSRCEAIAHKQRDRALAQLAAGRNPEEVIQELSQRLTNSLLHTPTLAIQAAGRRNDFSALAAYQKLFNDSSQD
ncbi:glutamyl-tRNA reductase [Aliidiomarina sanyensis]|uniref:Glutamyl-tRNA reductase n=1 Tax=Aliidiomarina sanyensis TaxID=1249555 RepID=A0A432WER7_9GAMM|nr:glutamyl-tRNA reductase [Aliidiomarina sanyensis]RUO31355.1 glutamyl-tRNA reductase [Aliidiomarina sanyensis]